MQRRNRLTSHSSGRLRRRLIPALGVNGTSISLGEALNILGGSLLAVGCLVWLVGSNVVLARATQRLGLRWPTTIPLGKLTRSEAIKLVGLLVILVACYLVFALMGSQ